MGQHKDASLNMKRIYFYSPGATGAVYNYRGKHLFLNTSPCYLHSHLIQTRPDLATQIEWTKIQLLESSAETIAEQLDKLNIDIFCVSVYIWNAHHVMSVVQRVRKLTSQPITIIAGGPSVDPHRNKNYLNDYPELDYAVYAQGEDGFSSILDYLINNKPLSKISTKNVSWRNKQGKQIQSEFHFIRRTTGSPYIDSQHILTNIVNDQEYTGYKFYFPYETSRGCAYNCSFCDWTSGLGHKVSHRTENIWEQELDLLGKLGLVNLHISDANFGQHRQDIEIAQTMANLKKLHGYKFSIIDTNFSKLKKKESFKILDVLADAKIVTNAKFAVQDTNRQVLDNVERPDIPWQEHKQYIIDALKKHPELQCRIELIQGLPGQTRETWQQTLLDVREFKTRTYPWIMLPNSPAGYDADYQRKMKIKTINVCLEGFNDQPQEVIVETFSYNLIDYMYFTLLSKITQSYLQDMWDRQLLFKRVNLCSILDTTLTSMAENFKQSKSLTPLIYNLFDQLFIEFAEWPQNILDRRNQILNSKVGC